MLRVALPNTKLLLIAHIWKKRHEAWSFYNDVAEDADFPECEAVSIGKYMVIQEESALLWEMIVWVILSKKVHTNMGPILNGYGVMTAWNLE